MNILCPFCAAILDLPPEALGRKCECPDCSHSFLVSRKGIPIVTHIVPRQESNDEVLTESKEKESSHSDEHDDSDSLYFAELRKSKDLFKYKTFFVKSPLAVKLVTFFVVLHFLSMLTLVIAFEGKMNWLGVAIWAWCMSDLLQRKRRGRRNLIIYRCIILGIGVACVVWAFVAKIPASKEMAIEFAGNALLDSILGMPYLMIAIFSSSVKQWANDVMSFRLTSGNVTKCQRVGKAQKHTEHDIKERDLGEKREQGKQDETREHNEHEHNENVLVDNPMNKVPSRWKRHRWQIISGCIVIILLILVFLPQFRYTTIKGNGNVVYFVDNFTGRTKGIAGTTIFDVKSRRQVSEQKKSRSLIWDECKKITGRMGISYGNRYYGTIYNGNGKIHVTTISIEVTTTIGGQKIANVYSTPCDIPPMSAKDLGFDIIRGDEGTQYQWFVTGAKGYEIRE